jgi:TonB-dependent receptor
VESLGNGEVLKRSRGLTLRCLLLGGACMALATTTAAIAQSEGGDQGAGVETIVVTGIRGSLQRNLDIKRESLGLVDAISAEDIGKFPDSNLAAAMQRIPGVSVSRASNMGTSTTGDSTQPTTTGDATSITVRGFGPNFNETLFDGRKISTATSSRAFDFSAVSADFVQQIDILKSPDAALSAGALGATINVKFPKPFDNPGLKFVASASSTFSPEDGHPTPNGDVLLSDTFANDTFGILADVAFTDTRTLANHDSTQGWEGTHLDPCQLSGGPACGASLTPDASKNNWYLQDYGVYQEHTNEQRINGRLVMQWRPTDALLITVNDDYARDSLHQMQYGYSIWFNQGSLRNVQRASDGTVINFVQPGTPTDFQGQFNGQVQQTNEVGFNVKWNVNDKLAVILDGDTGLSSLNPGNQVTSIDSDVGYGPSGPGGTCDAPQPMCNGTSVGIVIGPGHTLAFPSGIGPNGDASMFINNGLIGSHVLPITTNQNRNRVSQLKLEGDWTEGKLQIRAGFQFVANHANFRSYNDFTNNDWQAYSGYGVLSHNFYHNAANPADPYNGLPAGVALNQSWFTNSFSTAGFIPGWNGAGNLPTRILQFNPFTVLNYLQSLGNPQTKVIPGYNGIAGGCCNPAFDGTYRTVLVPGAFQQLAEDTFSGYVSASTETQIGGMPLKISVGVREEYTNFSTTGLGQLPTALTIQASDHTAFNTTFGPQSSITKTNSYQYLLPNLDLALLVTDDLQIRADASRTLTRPPFSIGANPVLSPVLSFPAGERVGGLQATGGNPDLLPFTSDNLDLSAEWYYAPNSYVSVDGFVKTVSNFIVGGSVQQPINGVIDPTTGQVASWNVTSYVNGPTANVYGGEFAVQHVFGDSGFGFQANATIVGTNKPYNPLNTNISAFAVTGLADSANIVAFYDKDGFQFRVAANWRDTDLDSFGQRQTTGLFGEEPTFVNPSTQIDMSTSYDITDQINVYFEALNLNDATYSTHGRFSEQLLDVVAYGRRFTFGVHFRL